MEITENIIKQFRDGIFALRTRRFGTVAELMIEVLYNFEKSQNQFHDRFDDSNNNRVEIKFSTVMKENEEKISRENVIKQIIKANLANRAVKSADIYDTSFDCNIQQVKIMEFDILYYGLFFADKIAIFQIKSEDVINIKGYSDFQHKGNKGEGQFHLNKDTIKFHFDNYFIKWISYEELYKIFGKCGRIVCTKSRE